MVTVDKLVLAANEGKKHLKLGNHSMEQNDKFIKFIYWETAVCTINKKTNKASYNTGGWNTRSTTKTINAYKKYFGA